MTLNTVFIQNIRNINDLPNDFLEMQEIRFYFHSQDIPLISVILPTYNKYKYLNRSFNSVQNQTLQNLELVAVDDYSNDQTTEFILERMKTDDRIKLVQHSYNQGTCNSRIHGVLSCKGDFIMSLDPDDLFYLNATQISYQIAVKLRADVIDILAELRHKSNRIKGWIPCKQNFSKNNDILNTLNMFNFLAIPWNLWRKAVKNSIYKKAVFLMIPFVENKRLTIGEDLIHCGCIFLFSNKFFCIKFIGYIYNYGLPENSHTDIYQSLQQNKIQKEFGIVLMRYFLNNRDNLEKVNLKEFLSLNTNSLLYKNISNVVRLPNMTKCNINITGYENSYYDKFDYCYIKRSKQN